MWYVRTAERLERTATWQRKLPGGIDFVRRVVIDDELGIAADLEADMARHVADYELRVDRDARRPRAPRPLRVLRQHRPSPTRRSPASRSAASGSRRWCRERHVRARSPRRRRPDRLDPRVPSGRAHARSGRGRADRRPSGRGVPAGDGELHAIDNVDPCSGASVLSRGLVGDVDGVATVASPMYKQRFDLRTGRCLDAERCAGGRAPRWRSSTSTSWCRCARDCRRAGVGAGGVGPHPRRHRAAVALDAAGRSCWRSTPASSTGSGST